MSSFFFFSRRISLPSSAFQIHTILILSRDFFRVEYYPDMSITGFIVKQGVLNPVPEGLHAKLSYKSIQLHLNQLIKIFRIYLIITNKLEQSWN